MTTGRRPDPASLVAAKGFAARTGSRFVERRDRSLEAIWRDEGEAPLVVVERDRIVCRVGEQSFFYHPGLVRMRASTAQEPLLEALELQEGDRVLDATLGRGGDAVLIASAVGETGEVVGLEASPVVAEIVRLGLGSYPGPTPELEKAMRRVKVVCADHRAYLAGCPDRSFDVVYFDPMFDQPLSGSTSLDPLRPLAIHDSLDRETVEQAARVARRRVVVKSRRGASTLEELGIPETSGGRWSRLVYGIRDARWRDTR